MPAGAHFHGAEPDGPILIGLVNNMPDAALRSTERQFCELLREAAQGTSVRLLFLSLPEVPRGEEARSHIAAQYEDFAGLWDRRLDGLIVTGLPPATARLQDETCWRTLAQLVDWADEHTVSTVWSCLAAHAAVLHLDGIERRLLPQKLSGVYECAKAAAHPIVAGLPERWCVPHSRYNELPEIPLIAAGYRVVSRSRDAGVDIFLRRRRSLFLFAQGHPEYDAGALFREYRRDVGVYLSGRSDVYPQTPHGYLDAAPAAALAAFERRALEQRSADLLRDFPDVAATITHRWRNVAVRLYANWLSYLIERKASRSRPPLPLGSGAGKAEIRLALKEDA